MKKFKIGLSTLILLIGLAGCSSTPTADIDSRQSFVNRTQQTLRDWEQRAPKLSNSQAADLRAMIADTRVELNRVQNASDETWRSYRAPVYQRIYKIQNSFGKAE